MNDLPRRQPSSDTGPEASLLAIASGLGARGLIVRKLRHDDEVIEISVTDPQHPLNGRVVVACEGWLTWEYDCPIESLAEIETTRNLVIRLLAHAAPEPDARGTGE